MTQSDLYSAFRKRGPTALVEHATDRYPVRDAEEGAIRTIVSGGWLGSLINHPSTTPLERVFRRLPAGGVFTATPQAPFSFELGAVRVPSSMVLVIFDWRFAIYEPSGIVAGDSQELEDRRLSTSVGYELRFNEHRQDNVRYEMTPSDPNVAAQESMAGSSDAGTTVPGSELSGVSAATFQRLRASNTRASVSSGASTIPQRHRRDAQLDMPFTYIVQAGQFANMRVHVFEAIPIPLSFFEGELSGMFVPMTELLAFVKAADPWSAT